MAANVIPNLQYFQALTPAQAANVAWSNNVAGRKYFAISWIGWHPVTDFAIHEFSYQYGIEIDAAALDNRQRIYNYLDNQERYNRFGEDDGPGQEVWWDMFSYGTDETRYVEMAKAYQLATGTYAILDVRDSSCVKDYVDTVRALTDYATANQAVELPPAANAAIRTSGYYNFEPHDTHSYWTRAWLAQEQIYSKELTYVYQIQATDPVEEISRTQCKEYLETLNKAYDLVKQFNPAHESLPVLERLKRFAGALTLSIDSGSEPGTENAWKAYIYGSQLYPRKALDTECLLDTMAILYFNMPDNGIVSQQQYILNSALNKMSREIMSEQRLIPIPRLNLQERSLQNVKVNNPKSYVYNTMIEHLQQAPRRCTSSVVLHGLGKARQGVEFGTLAQFLRVEALRMPIELTKAQDPKYAQPDVTPEEALNSAREPNPVYVQQEIVLQGLVLNEATKLEEGKPKKAGLIAVSETHYWVTTDQYNEVIGYVDVETAGRLWPLTLQQDQWETDQVSIITG